MPYALSSMHDRTVASHKRKLTGVVSTAPALWRSGGGGGGSMHCSTPHIRPCSDPLCAGSPSEFSQGRPSLVQGRPSAIMKIHIELEVAPDEVPMATELLSVLR